MRSYASRIVFLVLCAFYMSSVSCKIYLTQKMTIKIMNGLPNNDHQLKFRCQDGDKDLGMQILGVGEEYHWKFHNNVFDKSLWFCHFYWKNKNRQFEVYDDARDYPLCREHPSLSGKTCYWLVKEDGFYASTHPQDPKATDAEHEGILTAAWTADDDPINHLNPPPPNN